MITHTTTQHQQHNLIVKIQKYSYMASEITKVVDTLISFAINFLSKRQLASEHHRDKEWANLYPIIGKRP